MQQYAMISWMSNFGLKWINALIPKWRPTDNLWWRPKWVPWGYSATSYRGTTWIITGSPYKNIVEATARLVTCLQPTGSKERGHTTAWNMSKKTEGKHWHFALSVLFGFVIQQQKMRKLDVLRGVWPVDAPCMCQVWVWRVYVRDLWYRIPSKHDSIGPVLGQYTQAGINGMGPMHTLHSGCESGQCWHVVLPQCWANAGPALGQCWRNVLAQ